jgi:small-conductance mechanosensitive channel
MRHFFRLQSLLIQSLWVIALIITLVCLPWLTTAGAEDSQTANVELDGYRLFQVRPSEMFSAEQRVEDANLLLQEAVQSSKPAQVEVIERNQLPVIQVNGRYLMTVTQRDVPNGGTAAEQAQLWQQRIQQAIDQGQQQRRSKYIQAALIFSFWCVLTAIAVHWGLGWIWRHWLRRLIPRQAIDPTTGQEPQGIEFLFQSGLAIARAGLWWVTAIYISNLFPLSRTWSRQIVDVLISSLASPIVTLGKRAYSVVDLVILIGLLLGLVILARAGKTLLRTRVLRVTGMSRGAQEAVAFIANYALLFIGVWVLLQLWGLDLSSLTILASVLGVGIGLGLQGIAKEFFSGLVIIFERPVQVGDFIEVGDLQGTVERINVRSTEIRTLDQVSIIVPNSRFLESEVINWNHHSPVSRLRLPIGVAYGSSLSAVRAAMIEAAKDHPDVLAEPAPRVFFKEFGDSSLNFDLLVWIAEPRKQFVIKSDLYFRIEAMMRHRQIQIPFPQRDLHLRSGNLLPPELTESLARLSESLAAWLENQAHGSRPDSPIQNGSRQDDQRDKAIAEDSQASIPSTEENS